VKQLSIILDYCRTR